MNFENITTENITTVTARQSGDPTNADDAVRLAPFTTSDTAKNDGGEAMTSLIEPPKTVKATRLSVLDESDIRYREEREGIVRNSIKEGIAAAKALQEIHTFRDGALWKADYRSFDLYLQGKWGIQKSHGYRLLELGRFMCELKTDFSPFGEKLPDPESLGQVRPLLELVPEDYQVECWNQITSGTTPAKLTGTIVAAEAEKFLLSKGLKSKRPKSAKPTKADDRERALRDMAKFRASLAKLPQPERFESPLQDIQTLIDQDPDEPIPVKAAEVLTRDRNDPTPPAHSERNVHTEAKMSQVSQQEKCGITAESVAEAMEADAPTHEQNINTATAKLETPGYQRCVCAATTESESQQDTTDTAGFMNARLFHTALYQGEDYNTWLIETSQNSPIDIYTPKDGGDRRISYTRARTLAYNYPGESRMTVYFLIEQASKEDKTNFGKHADTLFQKHIEDAKASQHETMVPYPADPES